MEQPSFEAFDSRISTHHRALGKPVERIWAAKLYHAYSWHWNSTWHSGDSKGRFLTLAAAKQAIEWSRRPGLNHGVLEVGALVLDTACLSFVVTDRTPQYDALSLLSVAPHVDTPLRRFAHVVLPRSRPMTSYACFAATSGTLESLGPEPLAEHFSNAIPGGRYELQWTKRASERITERLRALAASC